MRLKPNSLPTRLASGLSPSATQPAVRRRAQTQALRWGWLPMLSVVAACGLLSLALANRLSAAGRAEQALYWLGLLTLVVPILARLLMPRVARSERLGLVLLFGLGLYLVKVMQSPIAFTYSDELIHLINANSMLATERLFAANPILPASAYYPGLESVTVALVQLAGLDVFTAGLVVIGLARFVMTLALFLLYERLTGSPYAAGLGSALYGANANYLYWSAQWSYESLALPLALLIFLAAARREQKAHIGWTLAASLLIGAVVITHHLTSYFVAAVLLCWSLVHGLLAVARRLGWLSGQATRRAANPLPLALFACLAVLGWLTLVAHATLLYLSPVFGKALLPLGDLLTGAMGTRGLFQGTTGIEPTPVWERIVGLAGVIVCVLGLPFGLRQVARRHWRQPFVLCLTTAALAYFVLMGLRVFPTAWEVSNRSSEFLFLGLGLVLAVGRLPRWPSAPWVRHGVLTLAATTTFAGGLIAGWLPRLRVAQVYEVTAGNENLLPASVAAARWAREHLGPGHTFAAHEVAGRLLAAYGDQDVLVGRQQGVRGLFEESNVQRWHIELLQSEHIEYLAVDRRLAGADNMTGYFFAVQTTGQPPEETWPVEAYAKFDLLPRASRIFDSGDVVVYDIRLWLADATQP